MVIRMRLWPVNNTHILVLMDYKTIIKDIRLKVGLNQKDFGKVCGVSQQVISNIERGKSEPSQTLVALLKYRYSDYFFRISDHDINDLNLQRLSDRQGRKHTREGILELFEDRQTARIIVLAMAEMEKTDPGILREIKGVIRMMQADQGQSNSPPPDNDPENGEEKP